METIQTWAIVLMIGTALSEAILSFMHNLKLFD
jgi:hypothetical protein